LLETREDPDCGARDYDTRPTASRSRAVFFRRWAGEDACMLLVGVVTLGFLAAAALCVAYALAHR
jgi:hypothetical protein